MSKFLRGTEEGSTGRNYYPSALSTNPNLVTTEDNQDCFEGLIEDSNCVIEHYFGHLLDRHLHVRQKFPLPSIRPAILNVVQFSHDYPDIEPLMDMVDVNDLSGLSSETAALVHEFLRLVQSIAG